MKCSKCSAQNLASAKFCAKCGMQVSKKTSAADSHLEVGVTQKAGNETQTVVTAGTTQSKKFGGIVVGALVLIGVVFFMNSSKDVCDVTVQNEVMKSSIKDEMKEIKLVALGHQGGYKKIGNEDSIESVFRGGMFKGWELSKSFSMVGAELDRVRILLKNIDQQISQCSRSEQIQELVDNLPFGKY